MWNAFRWLLELGVRGEIDQQRFRTGALTNITFVILAGIAFGASVGVHFPAGDVTAGLISLLFGVLYFVGLGMQARGWHTAARYLLVLLASLHYITICLVMGPQSGVGIYGIAFATSPFLLFAREEKRQLAISFVSLGVALLVGQYLMYAYGPLGSTPEHSLVVSRIFAFTAMVLYSGAIIGYYKMAVHRAEDDLLAEKGRSEDLLANILPEPISARLKKLENPIADRLDEVTVMFADLSGFTNFASRNPPSEVVKLLNEIFCGFDELADHHHLEKIKTIGDAYMVAGGLPGCSADATAKVAAMALDLFTYVSSVRTGDGGNFGLRVGIHVGPAVAGVIGRRKFTYDLWGDTVNLASRLQEAAPVGRILVSAETRKALDGRFNFEPRGVLDIRGIGPIETHYLLGVAESVRPMQAGISA